MRKTRRQRRWPLALSGDGFPFASTHLANLATPGQLMKYFEDFSLGQLQHSPRTHTVSEQEIVEFGTRWDSQPFHVDKSAAEQTEFGGLVASSTHLFAISIGLWNAPELPMEERTAAISALGFNNMKLRVPARPADVLRSVTTVLEKRDSASRPQAGILVFSNQVINQNDDVVFEFESAALYAKRPSSSLGDTQGSA